MNNNGTNRPNNDSLMNDVFSIYDTVYSTSPTSPYIYSNNSNITRDSNSINPITINSSSLDHVFHASGDVK